MHDKEAIDMMQRCRAEIQQLRGEIDRLRPKAYADDNLAIVLHLLPKQSVGMGEDLVWIINRRIKEIEDENARQASERASEDRGPGITG